MISIENKMEEEPCSHHPSTTIDSMPWIANKISKGTNNKAYSFTNHSKKMSSKQSSRVSESGRNRKRFFCCCFSRIYMLRSLLIFSLLAAVGICASLSYKLLHDAQEQTGIETYRSIATTLLNGAKAIALRKVQVTIVLSTLWAELIPNASDWPFIEFDGYLSVSQKIAELSSSTTLATMVFVNPSQVTEFENHTLQQYIAQGRPINAGYSDFGFGIWKPNETSTHDDKRAHDISGTNNWNGTRNILTTLTFHNQPAASSLMYNLYSEQDRGIHIDSMIDCVDRANKNSNPSSLEVELPACSVITDMLTLKIRPGPAALLFQPIFPTNDNNTFVGFATTSIHWQEVLEDVVPDFIDGIDCVISTNTGSSYTYKIKGGYPELLGDGDLHDRKYTHYGQSVILNDINNGYKTDVTSSATYTLTIYPTYRSLHAFSTNSPLAVSISFLGAILFVTLLFVVYDYSIRYESKQRKTILEMKRRFVRFISHEIRTPLNTVCMGLEILNAELDQLNNQINNDIKLNGIDKKNADAESNGCQIDKNSTDDHCQTTAGSTNGRGNKDVNADDIKRKMEDNIDFWHSITVDVNDNAQIAVNILNDLLNYDKLETGTMKLETDIVPIWDLVERTANLFKIQSVNRKVNLVVEIMPIIQTSTEATTIGSAGRKEDEEHDIENPSTTKNANNNNNSAYSLIGDDMRLSQVIRNLISNALKFTPADGTIEITASYIPQGLPNAKLLPINVNNDENFCQKQKEKNGINNNVQKAGSIRISVKDSGVGLSKEQLSLLFAEGVQFDPNRLQHGGGSGLGLCIAKGIVEQHNGTIMAQSDGFGCGTAFIVELPLCKFPAAKLRGLSSMRGNCDRQSMTSITTSSRTVINSFIKSEESLSDSGPRKVLVAEDSVSSRRMLIRLLERSGHICLYACNGQEAVNIIQNDLELLLESDSNQQQHIPIDTVLMDFEMPILTGPEATKELREMGYKGTIIGITGNVLEEDVEYFKEQGADEVLPKPISMDTIKTFLSQPRKIQIHQQQEREWKEL